MKTNRDEILKNCFLVFATMNYERASITKLSKACGLSRMGIHHYFPNKLAVFMAVVDRFLFDIQDPDHKFRETDGPLSDFIDRYIAGVRDTMLYIREIYKLRKMEGGGSAAPTNIFYFNLMLQARQYYPDAEAKFERIYLKTRKYWTEAIRRGMDSGELKRDLAVEQTAGLFHQIHHGLSFEHAIMKGLDIEELTEQYLYLYNMIRA